MPSSVEVDRNAGNNDTIARLTAIFASLVYIGPYTADILQ